MVASLQQEIIDNDGKTDLAVALDGSWQKRGFKSLNGVVTATSVFNGKVLDVAIRSKFCHCPSRYNDIHQDNCIANYKGK